MKLDDTSPEPTYMKVASAIRTAVADGELRPGDKLPSGPKLAASLGIATMTVRKAIEILQAEGLLRSAAGVGVFVTTAEPVASPVDQLRAEVQDLSTRVKRLEQLLQSANPAQPE